MAEFSFCTRQLARTSHHESAAPTQLRLRYKTAWSILHEIRQARSDRNHRYPLSGLIEIDDASFGGVRAGKRGRGAGTKTPVRVMVESHGKKRAGFVGIRTLPRVDRESVHEVVAEEIQPGQAIRTDAKRFLLGTYQGVSHRHLQRCLDELCYRFNRRRWEPQLSMRQLRACVAASPVTYAEPRG